METKKIVSDLIATGLTQQQLANLVPCGQSTINAFLKGKRGARPSLVIGQRLLELHKERVPERRSRRRTDVAPYVRKYPDPKISS